MKGKIVISIAIVLLFPKVCSYWSADGSELVLTAAAQKPPEPPQPGPTACLVYEEPGHPQRGREAFQASGCATCHASGQQAPGAAAAGDAVALASHMWNHAWDMLAKAGEKRVDWPVLTGDALRDIAAYLGTLPQRPGLPSPAAAAPDAARGALLFASKGCTDCHQGARSLKNRYSAHTVSAFAASMWNHATIMQSVPRKLTPEEMASLIAYICSMQIFEQRPARGELVFHPVAPALRSRP